MATSSCERLEPTESSPDLTKYLPFEPERAFDWTDGSGRVRLQCWSVLEEAARGGFWDVDDGGGLVYDGWFREDPGVELSDTVAEGLSAQIGNDDVGTLCGSLAGEWAIVTVDDDGVEASCDFLGSRHLYYGERNGRAVVSNRAMVAAAALFGGELPSKRPSFFGWLLTSLAAPFGDETPWPSIQLLDQGCAVGLDEGRCRVREVFAPPFGGGVGAVDWDEWTDEFVDRCRQPKRFPDFQFRLGLTGGKDSRLVFAGLLEAGSIDVVDTAYLSARPDNPDAVVGRRIAEHFGVDYELVDPVDDDGDVFERIDRHNFQTEYSLNAWNLKGVEHRRRAGSIHGNLGEAFRGHNELQFALGWPMVRRHYGGDDYVDPLRLLEPPVRDHCREVMLQWVRRRRADGHPRMRVHNAFHRKGRMQRWVGHAQLVDGCGLLGLNPIPSPGLFGAYRRLGFRNRQAERVHFELMHRLDDWLWRQPFAEDRWSRLLGPKALLAGAPLEGDTDAPSPQLVRWRRDRSRIREYLLDPDSSCFFEVVDRERLQVFFDDLGDQPDFSHLRAVWGMLGIRRALDEPFQSLPMSVEESSCRPGKSQTPFGS